MKKNLNRVTISGYVYSFGKNNTKRPLSLKKVENQSSANYGKDFIGGELSVAVDEEGLNVLTVNYTYVPATYPAKDGKPERENKTFTALKKILDNKDKIWTVSGKDEAMKVSITTSIMENNFVGRDNEIVSAKMLDGGLVSFVDILPDKDRNKFEADMLISRVTRVEADPERNINEDYCVLHGGVFNFRNEFQMVDFNIRTPAGMSYFESQDISSSHPFYTKVTGEINCITSQIEHVEETAFGEPVITYTPRDVREYLVNSAARFPYDFGEEEVMTAKELEEALAAREIRLADVKKRNDEYRNSQTNNFATAEKPAEAKKPTFNF